jgi:thiosulfate/3-mercaptopyruvate sulfurtransferase
MPPNAEELPTGPARRRRAQRRGDASRRPLISADELAARMAGAGASVLDVRWELASGALRGDYERGHIPGAAFVSLDAELSGPPGAGGRHPLPGSEAFGAAMRAAGVSHDRLVVVYDAASSQSAARAWWLLRYFGHPDVAVLNGGLAAWRGTGYGLETGARSPAPGDFVARPGAMPLLDAGGAAELAARGVLIDARAEERYRGEHEPVDPVAGHIPGAVNRPTSENVAAGGRFLDPDRLRGAFAQLGIDAGTEVGAYCGSGVTAAHEVLALELAGVRAALYAGSWSEWITDPARPVARA